MGVFPEPALCADDVSRLVPNETVTANETVTWLSRTRRKERRTSRKILSNLTRRMTATLLAGIVAGSVLPQDALAPAAAAHDRIDERRRPRGERGAGLPRRAVRRRRAQDAQGAGAPPGPGR